MENLKGLLKTKLEMTWGLSTHVRCQAAMPMPSLGECAARGLESSQEPRLRVSICWVGGGMLGSGPPALS